MSARDEGGFRPALIEIAASISAADSLRHDLRRRGAWLHRAGAIPAGFSLPHRGLARSSNLFESVVFVRASRAGKCNTRYCHHGQYGGDCKNAFPDHRSAPFLAPKAPRAPPVMSSEQAKDRLRHHATVKRD